MSGAASFFLPSLLHPTTCTCRLHKNHSQLPTPGRRIRFRLPFVSSLHRPPSLLACFACCLGQTDRVGSGFAFVPSPRKPEQRTPEQLTASGTSPQTQKGSGPASPLAKARGGRPSARPCGSGSTSDKISEPCRSGCASVSGLLLPSLPHWHVENQNAISVPAYISAIVEKALLSVVELYWQILYDTLFTHDDARGQHVHSGASSEMLNFEESSNCKSHLFIASFLLQKKKAALCFFRVFTKNSNTANALSKSPFPRPLLRKTPAPMSNVCCQFTTGRT